MKTILGLLSVVGLTSIAAVLARSDGEPESVVSTLPAPQEWKNRPETWKADNEQLRITAGKSTDWYISPVDGIRRANAPVLLFKPAKDFILTAKVTPEHAEKWDAGVLMVYANDSTWAKLALEKSMYMEPTIVTVVTRGVSDDCNSAVVSGGSIWFRVVKRGDAIGFFSSTEGSSWKLVRAFTLGPAPELRVGLGSQSPVGKGSTTVFSDISYKPVAVKDFLAGQ